MSKSAASSSHHCITLRDLSIHHYLAINPAIRVTEGAQRVRNCKIANAGVRIDAGRGTAHDALDDLEPCVRPDCDLLAHKLELAPGGPAGHVDIAAKAQRMHWRANRILDRRDRGKIDERHDLPGDVGK